LEYSGRKNMTIAIKLLAILLLLRTTICPAVAAEKHAHGAHTDFVDCALKDRVYISEVCVRPPPDKNWPAWVELWNHSSEQADITGWTLSTLHRTFRLLENRIVLEPDERLIIMFYAGDSRDNDFEERIPNAVRKIRAFNTTAFPPYKSHSEWVSRLSDSARSNAEADDYMPLVGREVALNAFTAQYLGTTRYINELALRTAAGDVIGYAAWGDKRAIDLQQYEPTAAREEARKKKLIGGDWNIPRRLGRTDSECAVLQLVRHALYRPLVRPEVNCSPGAPLQLDVKAPELLPVKPCDTGKRMGGVPCVFLRLAYRRGITDPIFELALGWSRVVFEVCYDAEMKHPVFRSDINTFYSPHEIGLVVPLKVSDYQQLAGKTLYFRAAKHHKHETSLYSDIQKGRMTLDGRIPDGDANANTTAKWPELAD
jgi:hypothetical protein